MSNKDSNKRVGSETAQPELNKDTVSTRTTAVVSRSRLDKKVKPKKKRKLLRKLFLFSTLAILTVGGFVGYKTWNKYSPMVFSAVTNGYEVAESLNSESLSSSRTTIIKDASGNIIKELNSISNLTTGINDVNPLLKDGFVAVEDERFYQHHGVDGWATLRASSKKITGGSIQGGSTITQQLVKNKILQDFEQTMSRKLSEMVIAQEVEKRFGKNQILESYLNNIYFGRGAYGVNAAAKAYFNKDQKDLTPREAAVIIGLTNNPSLYDPIDNPEESDKKVASVLYKMHENKVINDEQYRSALNEETVINQGQLFNEKDYTDNYAVSYAINKAAEELAKMDGFEFVYKFATDEEYKSYQALKASVIQEEINKILGGGFEIQTTIDMNLQKQIEDSVYQQLAGVVDINEQTGKLDLQTSVTVLDNTTHNVVAVVGGRGINGDHLNRAYDGYRQPGSTAKPIIAYAPAFDAGTLTPTSTLLDSQVLEYPTVDNASGVYSNRNWTVRDAVNMSLNTTALRASLGTDMGVVTDNLAKMGFARLHPYDVNNIIAIGGFTYGTTTTEMAGAYSSFTNQGNYVEPTNIETIKNVATGEVLYQNARSKVKVFSQESSFAMLDILKTSATGWTTQSQQAVADVYPKELQAGKTGTTDYYRDSYFVGVNAYYTTAVWIGRESNSSLSDWEQEQARAISRKLGNILLNGKAPKDFVKPSTVVKNGDSISFSSREDLNQVAEELTSSAFGTEQDEYRKKSKIENQDRLRELSYRIIYGLTLPEEQTLEVNAAAKIDEINVGQFDNKAKYEDYQELIAEAKEAVKSVKRPSANAELSQRLNLIQSEISTKYAQMLYQEGINKESRNQSEIDAAKSKAEEKKTQMIQEQLSKLQSALDKVTKSPTQANIDELDEIIYQLNRLGYKHGYYKVTVSNGKLKSLELQEDTAVVDASISQ